MPPIWEEIEQCKTDMDLRVVLQKHTSKNETNLNTMFYGIYWSEELMKAIRKGEFTASNMALFRTSEMGLRMIALVPRIEDERIEMETDYQRRRSSGNNVTTGDIKAVENAPRMPPLK